MPSPDVTRAVDALRVYLGSEGMPMRTQQRFYARARKLVERVANTRGMSETAAWEQIQAEARRLGAIQPRPGQHY